jgi:spore coat polysaccharide biosynthesis protein SpsF
MNLGIIIQARSGATRLPNKVLLPFYKEQTILDIQLAMLEKHFSHYPIILATTTNSNDDTIANKYASDKKIKVFRGDEQNVLKRFVDAAQANNISHIVRVCADNPFLSPVYLNKLIEEYTQTRPDYASYRFKSGTPAIRSHSGLFAEVTSLTSLVKILNLAVEPVYYEHVTNYIYTHPDKFKVHFIPVPEILNKYEESLRLTIDSADDFNQVKELYAVVVQKYGQDYTVDNLLAEVDSNVHLQESMRNRILQYAK